ncbi:MAG: hypothetical protein R3E01_35890 [Pirellulaceae bacterium]|nr:hypothetical protein [Planctomycetales bacterium]
MIIPSKSPCQLSIAVAFLLLALSGCGGSEQGISGEYGHARGTYSRGVNGTSVLAHMFSEAGFRVGTASRISRRVDKAQVVVWFPDGFQWPDIDVKQRWEQWLREQPGRTLVYVGRDYDATVSYWERQTQTSHGQKSLEAAWETAYRKADFDEVKSSATDENPSSAWFHIERHEPAVREFDELLGAWSPGVDADGLQIVIADRIGPRRIQDDIDLASPDSSAQSSSSTTAEVPNETQDNDTVVAEPEAWPTDPVDDDFDQYFTPLLTGDGVTLAARIASPSWGDSQIIVIPNGSYLLNLPLVNLEHRKLAGALIASCGPPDRLVFLEAGPSPAIATDEETVHMYMQPFHQWPISCILLHIVAMGILLCLSVFPIFGRPRQLPSEVSGDFGKHVRAFGGLLQKADDEAYASARIEHYRKHVSRETNLTPHHH